MIDSLINEIITFSIIAVVIILLAVMTKKREQDFNNFDKYEDKSEENK